MLIYISLLYADAPADFMCYKIFSECSEIFLLNIERNREDTNINISYISSASVKS